MCVFVPDLCGDHTNSALTRIMIVNMSKNDGIDGEPNATESTPVPPASPSADALASLDLPLQDGNPPRSRPQPGGLVRAGRLPE